MSGGCKFSAGQIKSTNDQSKFKVLGHLTTQPKKDFFNHCVTCTRMKLLIHSSLFSLEDLSLTCTLCNYVYVHVGHC